MVSGNTITYKGKSVALFYYPKTGVCNLCRAVEGETDSQRNRLYIRTHHIHHDKYDDKDVTAHTIELCPACHNREHRTGKARGGITDKNKIRNKTVRIKQDLYEEMMAYIRIKKGQYNADFYDVCSEAWDCLKAKEKRHG
jgi:hypothetical protein